MYSVEPVGSEVTATIDALPEDLVGPFVELRAALEVAPWSVGQPYVPSTPHGSRTVSFGAAGRGFVLFMVSEHERRVTLIQLVFL